MSRSALVGIIVALLAVTAALSVGSSVAGSPSVPETLATQGEFDQTEFRISVDENGSARWTFSYRQTLRNDSERAEFRTFAQDFNENETELYTDFQSRARSLVASGQNTTGREMSATDFQKRAYVGGLDDNLGVVEMSFRWTAFGVVEGQRVVIGDVFEGGLYIGPSQVLVVTHGDDLTITEFEPTPDDRSDDTLTYRGERSFADNRPRVVLVPPGAETPVPSPSTDTGSETPPPSTDTATPTGDGIGLMPLVALLVVLGLGGGAAYAYRSGAFDGDGAASASDPGDGGTGGGGGAAAAPPEPEISDEELLSDDDRVMKMLEERGGRMKQVNIVEETDWSKSKVSMLLSDMEEEGLISKLRVGRENIVSIAGQEPEAAGSPFDDEE